MKLNICHLCEGKAERRNSTIDCKVCGTYSIYPPSIKSLSKVNDRHLVSGYIREQNIHGQTVSLGNTNLEDECALIKRLAPRTVEETANWSPRTAAHRMRGKGRKMRDGWKTSPNASSEASKLSVSIVTASAALTASRKSGNTIRHVKNKGVTRIIPMPSPKYQVSHV